MFDAPRTLFCLALTACGGSTTTVGYECGPGTHVVERRCVPDDGQAAPGTTPESDAGALLEGGISSGPSRDASVPSCEGDVCLGDGTTIPSDVREACRVDENRILVRGTKNEWVTAGRAYDVHGGDAWHLELGYTGPEARITSFVLEVIRPDSDWHINFDTEAVEGGGLDVGLYSHVQSWAAAKPGHAGMAISGNGHGCDVLDDKFEILELQRSHDADTGLPRLQTFTAAFVQHCQGGPEYLVGCVHLARANPGTSILDGGPYGPRLKVRATSDVKWDGAARYLRLGQ